VTIRSSRRNLRSSSRSSLVSPGALPSSTSIWRFQFLSDCGETPSSLASLRNRLAAAPEQLDRLTTELQRIRRDLWHRQTSFPAGQMAQPSDVHQTGGTPEPLLALVPTLARTGAARVFFNEKEGPPTEQAR